MQAEENEKHQRVFAVGDIHGCVDEAEVLLRHLEEEQGLSDDDVTIFLGDYIDRGPNSRAVIDLVLEFKRKFPKSRFLKGNHEDMMLDFLGFGGNLGQAFLYNGGLETIQSYGISVFAPPREVADALPEEHFKFFCELEHQIRVDNYFCVHAGVNPERTLERQTDSDLLWIREEFLSVEHEFDFTVVFGHTPHQEVFLHLPYKIGLDTGLVFGNKISCLELHTGQLMQVFRDSKDVEHSEIDLTDFDQ